MTWVTPPSPLMQPGPCAPLTFAPAARDIASIILPAKAATNVALVASASVPPMIAVGLSDGSLALIRRD